MNISCTVETISPRAFDGCSSMESITIPGTVTYIDGRVFANCTGLRRIVCEGTTPNPISDYAFKSDISYSIYDNATLFVPYEAITDYCNHRVWGKFFRVVPFIGAGPGDVNGDGVVNISDVTSLINMLLSGGDSMPEYVDVSGDGKVSIGDVTTLINMLLRGY